MWLYRSFLVLAAVWLLAGAASAQTYDDPTIGFSIVKPPGWFFADEREMERSRQLQKLDNPALEALIAKNAEKPLLVLTKFKEPYDDVNPSVSIQAKPLGPFKGATPAQVAKTMAAVMAKMRKGAQLEQCSEDTKLSGLPAAYCQLTYTLPTSIGDFPLRARLWVVRRQEHFFLISGTARQDERNGTFAEVEAVIRSIKIDVRS